MIDKTSHYLKRDAKVHHITFAFGRVEYQIKKKKNPKTFNCDKKLCHNDESNLFRCSSVSGHVLGLTVSNNYQELNTKANMEVTKDEVSVILSKC